MKSYRIFAFALAVAVAASGAAVRAQVTTAPPIIIKAKHLKDSYFKGEVLHADSVSIIVRSREDPRFIRTFNYSPKVHDKMEEIIANGNYQYGDRVVIRFRPGEDNIAIDIRGRPSPPL